MKKLKAIIFIIIIISLLLFFFNQGANWLNQTKVTATNQKQPVPKNSCNLPKITHSNIMKIKRHPQITEIKLKPEQKNVSKRLQSKKSILNMPKANPPKNEDTFNSPNTKPVFTVVDFENSQSALASNAKLKKITFIYTPNEVYKIYCNEKKLTDIQLQPGEKILFCAGGDPQNLMIKQAQLTYKQQKQTHVYVKPLIKNLKTNLIINTNKHSYHLEIYSKPWHNAIINWKYPKEEINSALQKQSKKLPDIDYEFKHQPSKFNIKYKIYTGIFSKRKYTWAPLAVFDDGYQTYLMMPPKMIAKDLKKPLLFIKEPNGYNIIGYRIIKNYYVIDRLFEKAQLKMGKKVVRIKRIH